MRPSPTKTAVYNYLTQPTGGYTDAPTYDKLTESWADMRRYHYFDVETSNGIQVYKTYVIPVYSTNNQGPKPAYRFAPTNFSEFDWNFEEIRKLGALNIDYHTYEMWFTKP